MSYPPPYGSPGGYPPPYGGGYPPYGGGYSPYGGGYPGGYQQSMFNVMMCSQPMGLGGQQQMIPIQRPIDLNMVVQQVVMYLMGQGFQVYPFVGQNMAVIQAQHQSFLGFITDSNKAYTIRLCEGPNFVMVETGFTNLMQELLPLLATGGTAVVGDDVLHSKLLELLGLGGAGIDVYNLMKDFMQEQQIMNTIMMAIQMAESMAPPYPPQPYGQPYGAPYGQPSTYPQPMQRPAQQPTTQQPAIQSTTSQSQSATQSQTQAKTIKCWNCGEEVPADSKFCPRCGANLMPVKCPKCGYVNSPGAKFCSNCGAPLQQALPQTQQKS
ncbi:MAG: zinc ribbon domain-containing protein [Sulfolobus sp.]